MEPTVEKPPKKLLIQRPNEICMSNWGWDQRDGNCGYKWTCKNFSRVNYNFKNHEMNQRWESLKTNNVGAERKQFWSQVTVNDWEMWTFKRPRKIFPLTQLCLLWKKKKPLCNADTLRIHLNQLKQQRFDFSRSAVLWLIYCPNAFETDFNAWIGEWTDKSIDWTRGWS